MVFPGQWLIHDSAEFNNWRFREPPVSHSYGRDSTGVGIREGTTSGSYEAISPEADQRGVPNCTSVERLQTLGLQARRAHPQIGYL